MPLNYLQMVLNYKIYLIAYLLLLLGCNTTQKTIHQSSKSSRALTSIDSAAFTKQLEGVDFIASGSNPVNWKLELDFDKTFIFSSTNNITIKTSPVKSVKNPDGEGETYFAKSPTENMIINLTEGKCKIDDNKSSFNKKVEIKISNITYTGCGDFLYDARINDNWTLEFINDEPQFPINYPKGLPNIKFNLTKNKVTGFNGCYNFESDIEVKGNRIQFSPFQKKNIPCDNDKAARLLNESVSNQLVDYYFKEGKLILYLSNDNKLSFKKAD